MSEQLHWKDRAEQLPEKYQGLSLDDETHEMLMERYQKMQYEPGEAIGIVAAQSLAEPATQLTMETYHQAGGAQVSLTAGLPRLIEIVDARREPKTPAMDVYLKEEFNSKEEAKKLARKLREVKFDDLVRKDTLDIMGLKVEYELNKDLLEDYDIEMDDLPSRIKDSARKAKVSVEDNTVILESSEDDYDLRDLKDLKNKVEDSRIKGLKGIEQVVINEEDGDWQLQTAGTALRKTLKIKEVDPNRTISNHLFEVLRVLGVEALRQRIIVETNETLGAQGISIDDRHIMLLADMMTRTGDLKGTTRYGIVGDKESMLARSVFEETKKHLREGTLGGEVDEIEGVVENLITGQPVPVGTGVVDLKPNFSSD